MNSRWSHPTPPEFGIPEALTIAGPAVGAEWTQTVPNNTLWLVTAVGFTLLADANVATRESNIILDIGGVDRRIGIPANTQAAGQSRQYLFTWSPHGANPFVNIPGMIPHRLYLQPGWILESVTTGIQVGDQYSSIFILVQRWLPNI